MGGMFYEETHRKQLDRPGPVPVPAAGDGVGGDTHAQTLRYRH